jgi:hypothetical protein
MNAFIKTEQGLFKAYKHDSDWQVIGPQFERWFSVWAADVAGSLDRALASAPGLDRHVQIVTLGD